jgi:hypothetical protein
LPRFCSTSGYHPNLRYWKKTDWDWIAQAFEESYPGQRFLDHAWRIQLEFDGLVEDRGAELLATLAKALAKPPPEQKWPPSVN